MDLKNPKTLNEKINILKFRQTGGIFSDLSDKYKVRKHIADTIGPEVLVKLYWMGKDPEAIPFSELPMPYIIKCNHGSGFNIFVREPKDLDIPKIKAQLREWLKTDFSRGWRELHYRGIDRRIIIEEILIEENCPLITDYRIFCFHGEPKMIQLRTYQDGMYRKVVYDLDWKKQGYFWSEGVPYIWEFPKPDNLDTMLKYARKLSTWFAFLRLDLYRIGEKIYFGELTFTADNGFGYFQPEEENDRANLLFGSMIDLSKDSIVV